MCKVKSSTCSELKFQTAGTGSCLLVELPFIFKPSSKFQSPSNVAITLLTEYVRVQGNMPMKYAASTHMYVNKCGSCLVVATRFKNRKTNYTASIWISTLS